MKRIGNYSLHHTDMGEGYHKIEARDSSGRHAGLFRFGPAKEHETHLVPMHAEVKEAHRRKGVATAAYDHIEHVTGKKLKPSLRQTSDAKAFWDKRLKKGLVSKRGD
jgi:hypothetical protein